MGEDRSISAFPDGFMWGASTAGHQVEGGNVNADLWPLEWAEGSLFTEPSGDACDHYHRYPEDIGILADLGFNTYRFSLEWARIEPEPGYISRSALDHYRRMIGACLDREITPLITFCHFTTPRWFAGRGGWATADAPDRFGRYAEAATTHLGDLLGWVATLNEPNVVTMMKLTGALPMGVGERSVTTDKPQEAVNSGVGGYDPGRYRMGLLGAEAEQMAAVHRVGVEAIKAGSKSARVGWTLAIVDLQSAAGGEQRLDTVRRRAQLDWLDVSRDDDWVGVQTYSRQVLGADGPVPVADGTPTHQTGWEVYPEAIGNTVRLASAHSRVPIIVTENGIATDVDEDRIAHTRTALESLAECIDDGIDVRGYCHWSLLDNFEWMAGYTKDFGLVAVDPHTFERRVKPSARWLGEVAKANSLH